MNLSWLRSTNFKLMEDTNSLFFVCQLAIFKLALVSPPNSSAILSTGAQPICFRTWEPEAEFLVFPLFFFALCLNSGSLKLSKSEFLPLLLPLFTYKYTYPIHAPSPHDFSSKQNLPDIVFNTYFQSLPQPLLFSPSQLTLNKHFSWVWTIAGKWMVLGLKDMNNEKWTQIESKPEDKKYPGKSYLMTFRRTSGCRMQLQFILVKMVSFWK